ncbi:MAG TPA: hypothetical protein VH165_11260 [Kofleriaceae bacterium]|jgi:hypothetical protein|nr:hypothetical protein [Kofleriaceae bacterium]
MTRRLVLVLAIAAAAGGGGLAGCTSTDRPLLICHNANCVEGSPTGGDDTLDALRGSLALRMPDGTHPYDGVEIDSVWDRARGQCTFAHDPDPAAPELAEAAQLIVDHLTAAPIGGAAHGAARGVGFYLKIELKVDVGGGATHTPDEVAAHVGCVLDAAQAAISAGLASGNPVVPIFDSDDPKLLAAIPATAFSGGAGRGVLFEAEWGAALPASFAAQISTLGWFDDPRAIAWDVAAPVANERDVTGPRGGLLIWARDPSLTDLSEMLEHHPAYLGVNNISTARDLIDAE